MSIEYYGAVFSKLAVVLQVRSTRVNRGNLTNEMSYKLTTIEAQEALYKLKEYLIEKEQATDLFALAKDHTSLE